MCVIMQLIPFSPLDNHDSIMHICRQHGGPSEAGAGLSRFLPQLPRRLEGGGARCPGVFPELLGLQVLCARPKVKA